MSDELKVKWDRLWHFFKISQQFGRWDVKMKGAPESENDLILKTKEILTEFGVFDKPELINDVFYLLSEKEKNTCLEGLEVILKYIKYRPGF